MSLDDWKREFDTHITTHFIKYDWDAGHCYSYIDHPLMKELELLFEEDQELMDEGYDYSNSWLYENDDCPPCAIHINHTTKEVSSGCGCHDNLPYKEGLDKKQALISHLKLTNQMNTQQYVITEES